MSSIARLEGFISTDLPCKFVMESSKTVSTITKIALPIFLLFSQTSQIQASTTPSSTVSYCAHPNEYYTPDCAIDYLTSPFSPPTMRLSFEGSSEAACENLLDQFGNDWCETYFNNTDFTNDDYDFVFAETNAKLAAQFIATGNCIISSTRNESAVGPEVFCDQYIPVNASDYVPMGSGQGSNGASSGNSGQTDQLPPSSRGSLTNPSSTPQTPASSSSRVDSSEVGSVPTTSVSDSSGFWSSLTSWLGSTDEAESFTSVSSSDRIRVDSYVTVELIISGEITVINHPVYGEISVAYDPGTHSLNLGLDLAQFEDGDEIDLFTFASDFDASGLDLIVDTSSTCRRVEHARSEDTEESDRSVYVMKVIDDTCGTGAAAIHSYSSAVLATAVSLLPPMYQRMANRVMDLTG